MKRLLWSLAAGLIAAGSAAAQFPGSSPIFPPQYAPNAGGIPPNVMQNYYNRGNQPLSPYLNMFRGTGSNPAVDYYYGVRPGTPSGGQQFYQQMQRGNSLFNSQMRTGYIPQAAIPSPEEQPLPDPNRDVILPVSGHGVSYGNVYGVSRTGIPGVASNNSRAGFFQAPTTGTAPRGAATGRQGR